MSNFRLHPGLFVIVLKDPPFGLAEGQKLQVMNLWRGGVCFVGVNGLFPVRNSGKRRDLAK